MEYSSAIGAHEEYTSSRCSTGISSTTGFHPLFAYILSLIYKLLQPSVNGFVLCGLVFSSLFTLTTLFIVWLFGLRRGKTYFLAFLTLLISSENYTYNSISILEWPLVILLASLYVIYFHRIYKSVSVNQSIILFSIGFLGSLSRSDFGLLPFTLCVMSLVFGRLSKNKRAIFAALSGLIGASLGVLLVFIHNYNSSGSFLQSSAKMKAYWGQISGVSYLEVKDLLYHMVFGKLHFPIREIVVIIFLFAVIIPFYAFWQNKERKLYLGFSRKIRQALRLHEYSRELILVTSAGLCITGYVFVYARNGAIQPWYSANLIVPVFIMLVTTTSFLDSMLRDNYRKITRIGVSVIVLTISVYNIITIHRNLSDSPWPHQQIMLEAGKYLQKQTLDGKTASWNAGIIGYYQGGTVINIDGLVNDDIYIYAIDNKLPSYLAQKKVRYIIDFKEMISDKIYRIRGGYDDEAFLNRLQPIKVFDDGRYGWTYMTLYTLSPK